MGFENSEQAEDVETSSWLYNLLPSLPVEQLTHTAGTSTILFCIWRPAVLFNSFFGRKDCKHNKCFKLLVPFFQSHVGVIT